MSSIYQINKGVNKSIEFRGLKAQYIWYFATGVLLLMILFSVLYICGLNSYLCLLIIGVVGGLLVSRLYRWSNTYGEHGILK